MYLYPRTAAIGSRIFSVHRMEEGGERARMARVPSAAVVRVCVSARVRVPRTN